MTASYLGTTQLSSVANPPFELMNTLGGAANRICPGTALWSYCSTNSATEVTTANFFSDGVQLGMKVGDIVFVVYQTSVGSTSPLPYMGVIGASSTSGVTLTSLTS
jgi:hypothetical protein